jgi:hypothetical protein
LKIKCECGGKIREVPLKEGAYRYVCNKCGVERRIFEVIPYCKIVKPLEKSWAYSLPFWLVDMRINIILGKSKNFIHISSTFYANPRKRFHFDILARDENDLVRIIKENWEKLRKVMNLFGEDFKGWELLSDP